MSPAWSNWAGDQTCRPAEIVRPSSVEEVSGAILRARERGWNVRVAGSGHSFSEAVPTDGMLLSLDRSDRVLDISPSGSVRVEAGITLRSLNAALARAGRALENLGDIDAQSVAGATATGTHGTGARFRNLSAGIESLQLVTADGAVTELDEAADPDAWRAARVSIGALGVITALTLKTVPAFTLRGVDGPRPLEEVLASLDDLVDSNEHFEFYTFPHSPIAQTRVNNRVSLEPHPPSRFREWRTEVLENRAFALVQGAGRVLPALVPALDRLSARSWGRSERVDRSDRIFVSNRRVRFTEAEYAIPREHAVEAVRIARRIADRKELRVSFPIEVRFVAPDDALISPAAGRDTCYVAFHVYRKGEWRDYFAAVEEAFADFGARPHWGKRSSLTFEVLGERYPEWERFAAVRDRLDPQRTFANDFTRRVLGP